MRRALLWLATMTVGGATLLLVLSLLSGDVTVVLAAFVMWLLALAIGLPMSAPAFLDPPDDGGLWSFRVPLVLWLFLMMLRLTSAVGFYTLLGCWLLIFQVWKPGQGHRRPSFGAAPPPVAAPQPYAPPVVVPRHVPPRQAATTGPSWQRDPTGRFMYRWWDGYRWTDRVASGRDHAVDPL